MSDYRPQNFRIYRLVTRTRILTVEDALRLGKIVYTLTEYERGAGAKVSVVHYMDQERAALLSWDLLSAPHVARGDVPSWWNGYTEYKGTSKDEELEARTFRIELATKSENPIRITITNGPGEPVGTAGAIKPRSGTQQSSVTTLLKWQDARAMALQTLMHLQAWHTMTYHRRLQEGTWAPGDNAKAPTVDPDTGEILDH